jgi:hypothetical protein
VYDDVTGVGAGVICKLLRYFKYVRKPQKVINFYREIYAILNYTAFKIGRCKFKCRILRLKINYASNWNGILLQSKSNQI